MALLIIADASPLIGLAKIGQLDLLPMLYKQVTIPPAVRDEICPVGDYAGAQVLAAALEADWLVVAPEPDNDGLASLMAILDRGEAQAIALAMQHENARLIIDERRGRTVAAQRQISIMGTGAVLLAAKQQGYLETIAPSLDALGQIGYRLSQPLVQRLLELAGEAR